MLTDNEKLDFLASPASYPHAPEQVEVRETHMSWIFMAGDLVYKLKKPVRFPFLDFPSLKARRRFVSDEVDLNRRLAPEVYRGAVPLTREPDGRLALGGSGRPVDWLVEMLRLPEDRMLDAPFLCLRARRDSGRGPRGGGRLAAKRACTRRVLAVRELNHRVSNELQALISLMRMRSGDESAACRRLCAACISQAHAIVHLHEVLRPAASDETLDVSGLLEHVPGSLIQEGIPKAAPI